MSFTFPKTRVGDPVQHRSLCVFPLFSELVGEIDYRLSESALADETLLVEEVDQRGSVPDLLVENKGDRRVLFLEGEELIGAKQNRVLNTSVLVAAHSKIKIPVSCVEQGRWHSNSSYFRSSGSHSPSKLRRALKASVGKSVKEKRGHQSDQGEVWKQIACLHSAHAVESKTDAMSDAFESYADRITNYLDALPYVDRAIGMAVAIAGKIISVDLFDKPSTCEKVWRRMLSGLVFDALETDTTDGVVSVSDVEQLISAANELSWAQSDAVGEGDEYRAESEDSAKHGSALTIHDSVIHGSVLTY